MSNIPAVCLKNVSFAYDDGRPILEHIELAIMESTFTAIVGPNGGGKTTLLRLILGQLVPSSGEIHIFGRSPREAREKIGYVPQQLRYDQLFPITVSEVVLMGTLTAKSALGFRYGEKAKEAARAALSEVGLALWNEPFHALSGGQRQRVLIARALVGRPELLLLDEPTANLDAAVSAEFYELLSVLNKDMTILLVSHDMEFVAQNVSSVVCVNHTVDLHPTSAMEFVQKGHLKSSGLWRRVRHDISCATEEHHHD